MKLLLKREQTTGWFGGVKFQLWVKVELDENERAVIKRYKFDQTVLIGENDIALLRRSIIYGGIVAFICVFLLNQLMPISYAAFMGSPWGFLFAYFYFNENRDELLVRDLLYGRHFNCPGVVQLMKKEATISDLVSILRQVMESAKKWDGTEVQEIRVLSREDARNLILQL